MIAEKINSYGLEASIDPVGNVIACRKGTDPDGPVCVISAHMDNSFREGTDTTVRRQNGRLFAPGISDASRALACMLQVIRMVVNNDIKTKGTLLFIATVGQEAEGDLRGVKRIFYSSGIHVDGVLVLDGADPGRLLYGSVGSKRYKIEYSGPGGHSYLNFWSVSERHSGTVPSRRFVCQPPGSGRTQNDFYISHHERRFFCERYCRTRGM